MKDLDLSEYSLPALRAQRDRAVAERDAALAALKAATEWRPMSEAPRDGREVLLRIVKPDVTTELQFRAHLVARWGGTLWEERRRDHIHAWPDQTFICWLPLPEVRRVA